MYDEKKYRHKITVTAIGLTFIVVLFFVAFYLSAHFGLNSASIIFAVLAFITLCSGIFLISFLIDKGARHKKLEQDKKTIEQEQERNKIMLAEQEMEVQRQRKIRLVKANKLEISGRYEDAARIYDDFEMYEKAGECRRMAKTSYQISTNFSMGKNGTISSNCPTCGSSQTIESKSNMVICKHCGNNYVIPKKILDSM